MTSLFLLSLLVACGPKEVQVESLFQDASPPADTVLASWDGGQVTWEELGDARDSLTRIRSDALRSYQETLVDAVKAQVRSQVWDAEAQRRGLDSGDALREVLVRETLVSESDLDAWMATPDGISTLEQVVQEKRINDKVSSLLAWSEPETAAWIQSHPGETEETAHSGIVAQRMEITAEEIAKFQEENPGLDLNGARTMLVQGRLYAMASELYGQPVTEGDLAAARTDPQAREALRGLLQEQRAGEALGTLERTLLSQVTWRVHQAPPVRATVSTDGAPTWGPSQAPVTLVVFSDFQCPYCSRLQDTLKEIQSRYPTQVRFAFRDFPLDFHAQAMPAAVAASCAHRQGRYADMQALLFRYQGALEDGDLERYAQQVGLDMAAWKTCLTDPSVRAGIDADMAAGTVAGVQGVPMTFVNGIAVSGAQPLEAFTEIIDAELTGR